MDLALFDFDGTITIDPTYPAFVRFAVRTSVGLKSAQFLWQAGPHERVTIGSVRVERSFPTATHFASSRIVTLQITQRRRADPTRSIAYLRTCSI